MKKALMLCLWVCLGCAVLGCGKSASSNDDAEEECVTGAEGCDCGPEGGCFGGLTCLSNTCVNAGTDSDSNPTADADADADTDADTDSDADSDADADTDADSDADADADADSDTDADADTDTGVIPTPNDIQGLVQKGPFSLGSEVTVRELNDSYEATGNTFSAQVVNALGGYGLDCDLVSDYIELNAQGFYYNEMSNRTSSANLSVGAIAELSAAGGNIVNINLLTTLSRKRIRYLIENGLSFTEAQSQAEAEVLAVFNIPDVPGIPFEKMEISRAGEANAMLLAVSLILQGSSTVGEMSSLVALISGDIETDGVLNSSAAKETLLSQGMMIGPFLPTCRSYLETYFENAEQDTAVVPMFEAYCDNDGDGVINKYDFIIDFPASQGVVPGSIEQSIAVEVVLPPGVSVASAAVTSGTGVLVVNGDEQGTTASVVAGDLLQVSVVASDLYNTSTITEVSVTYGDNQENSGSFSVTTIMPNDVCDIDSVTCETCLTCADINLCDDQAAGLAASAAGLAFGDCVSTAATVSDIYDCVVTSPDGVEVWLGYGQCAYEAACPASCIDNLEKYEWTVTVVTTDPSDINYDGAPCYESDAVGDEIACFSWAGWGGPCTDATAACLNNSTCTDLQDCINNSWPDDDWEAIQADCFDTYSEAEALYWGYMQCIYCDACSLACAPDAGSKKCDEYSSTD